MKRIIIIGGGVSGIVTGIFSKKDNNEVIILEKNNDCLKKLLMTGNGKCNYFNDDFDISHYHSCDIDKLSNIITEVNKKRVLDFINSIGIMHRIKNGYYYPASNQAYSVHNALIKEALNKGVKIYNGVNVLGIDKTDQFIVHTNNGDYVCDNVVISTGSCAYPKTGSDGDGYKFGSHFNHKVNTVYPALVQLVSSDKFLKDLSGVRSDVFVSIADVHGEVGEIQFTDYGLSGICIYNLSIYVNKLLEKTKSVVVNINFMREYVNDIDDFIALFNEQDKLVSNRGIVDLLEGFLNYKIVNVILSLAHIDRNLSWKDLSYDQRCCLGKLLISFEVNVVETKGFNNSQVCVGGVSLSDIDISNFSSNIVDGLYFTGEVLDVCGDCGGYNLAFAFLSGMIVGDDVSEKN